MQTFKVLCRVLLTLTLVIFLLSCGDTPEKEVIQDKICVYKLATLACTQPPNCPPRRTFYTCDTKLNAYKYDLNKYEIEDCNC